jgi:hypothetical protein
VWRRENSLPYRDSNSNPSVFQPVASSYIDYVIPAHIPSGIGLLKIKAEKTTVLTNFCNTVNEITIITSKMRFLWKILGPKGDINRRQRGTVVG